jgi:hypothetical protein
VRPNIETDGFAFASGVLPPTWLDEVSDAFGDTPTAGRRGMLSNPRVAKLANSTLLLDLVRPHLPHEPRPVRAIAFDKSPDANWLVAWHQDLTIAVRERRKVPGFGPWSVKNGIPHVQPPVELLEQMLAVRLHLDPADESNGALRVLAGSHRNGRLSSDQIEQMRAEHPEVICRANPGDALLMRPLLLHASSRAAVPTQRRVLHIEYAGVQLPAGLDWHSAA